MNRLTVAAMLLVFVIAGCWLFLNSLQVQTQQLIDEVDALLTAFDEGDPLLSLPDTQQLLASFRSYARLFAFVCPQRSICELSEELNTLPLLLEQSEPKDFPATLMRCRTRLIAFYEGERPIWENIF